jgi:hypothetical protein
MARPTVEEVSEYCVAKGYTFSPEHFHAYYESNGWKVGKNPMKSWKAACKTWQSKESKHERVRQGTSGNRGRQTAAGAAQRLRDSIARDEAVMAQDDGNVWPTLD